MNLKTFALLALAWLWAGAAFAADPQTGLTVTQGSGTNLCGFTGGSLGSQIYTCTIPVFQNGSGVGSVVSSTNGLPVIGSGYPATGVHTVVVAFPVVVATYSSLLVWS